MDQHRLWNAAHFLRIPISKPWLFCLSLFSLDCFVFPANQSWNRDPQSSKACLWERFWVACRWGKSLRTRGGIHLSLYLAVIMCLGLFQNELLFFLFWLVYINQHGKFILLSFRKRESVSIFTVVNLPKHFLVQYCRFSKQTNKYKLNGTKFWTANIGRNRILWRWWNCGGSW